MLNSVNYVRVHINYIILYYSANYSNYILINYSLLKLLYNNNI